MDNARSTSDSLSFFGETQCVPPLACIPLYRSSENYHTAWVVCQTPHRRAYKLSAYVAVKNAREERRIPNTSGTPGRKMRHDACTYNALDGDICSGDFCSKTGSMPLEFGNTTASTQKDRQNVPKRTQSGREANERGFSPCWRRHPRHLQWCNVDTRSLHDSTPPDLGFWTTNAARTWTIFSSDHSLYQEEDYSKKQQGGTRVRWMARSVVSSGLKSSYG